MQVLERWRRIDYTSSDFETQVPGCMRRSNPLSGWPWLYPRSVRNAGDGVHRNNPMDPDARHTLPSGIFRRTSLQFPGPANSRLHGSADSMHRGKSSIYMGHLLLSLESANLGLTPFLKSKCLASCNPMYVSCNSGDCVPVDSTDSPAAIPSPNVNLNHIRSVTMDAARTGSEVSPTRAAACTYLVRPDHI